MKKRISNSFYKRNTYQYRYSNIDVKYYQLSVSLNSDPEFFDNLYTIRKISASTNDICCFLTLIRHIFAGKIQKHGKQKKVQLFRNFYEHSVF